LIDGLRCVFYKILNPMKYTMLFILGLVATSLSAHQINENPTSVDLTKSSVKWKAYKVTGEHEGDVQLKSADLQVEEGVLKGGNFVVEMTSLKATDLEGSWADKLNGHLKSPDFFDVENHPEAKYVVTKITSLEGDDKAQYLVYGNLTMKDSTKQVAFKANIDYTEDGGVAISAPDFTIDRSEFAVKYGSTKFFEGLADKAINDNIGLSLVVSAK